MPESALVLVLFFSPFQIGVLQRGSDMKACTEEAAKRIGEKMHVTFWDDMGGSRPIPKVVAAFCAPGTALEK